MADVSGIASVRRVRKAYEQVADQLRDLIMSGEIGPATRLPNEAALAAQFGVSRPTIREALRVLSTQALIRTTKGASGGSFVTVPTVDHISDFLSSNISLLSQSEEISLAEFLEARELLEVPAVRLAAHRHNDADIGALRATIPGSPLELDAEERFTHNKNFHSTLMLASGNALLSIAAQPVFSILQANLRRSALGRRFHQRVNEDHRALVATVEAGDADAAEELMRKHLDFIRPMYEKAWRHGRGSKP